MVLKIIKNFLLEKKGERFLPVLCFIPWIDSRFLNLIFTALLSNLWINLTLFCLLVIFTYMLCFSIFIFIFCFEKFLWLLTGRSKFDSVNDLICRFIFFFFFLFFYEFFFFLMDCIFLFLNYLNGFFLLLGYLAYFFCLIIFVKFYFKALGAEAAASIYKLYTFFSKRINYFISALFFMLPLLFVVDHASYESHHAATSFASSLSVFFFVQFNTFFLLVLILAHRRALAQLPHKDVGTNFFISNFFLRCTLLSIGMGLALDFLLLFSLNFLFSHTNDSGVKLTGVVMLFRSSIRIDEANLYFVIFFSCAAGALLILLAVLQKICSNCLSARLFLRFNFLIAFIQNISFIHSQQYKLVMALFAAALSIRFLILVFSGLARGALQYVLSRRMKKSTEIKPFQPQRFNGFFGIGLIDLFNWRGIIKPLNWVYVDANKSILVAEQTTEIIVAAKLKTILGGAKAATYIALVGGAPLAFGATAALAGALEISLIFDGNLVATFCDSALNTTWHAFQESAARELDSYFKGIISSLDQTPYDKVPLRKCDQLVLDKFDAASEEEVIRRRNLAREGWVYAFFSYVVSRLLWRLVMRLIFGGGDDDDAPGGTTNDRTISW